MIRKLENRPPRTYGYVQRIIENVKMKRTQIIKPHAKSITNDGG